MNVNATVVLFGSLVCLSFMLMTLRRFYQKKQQLNPTGSRFARWKQRLQSPQWRRYGFVLFAGKFAGLAILAARPDVLATGPRS